MQRKGGANMTGSDLVIFTVLYLFSIIGIPMLFIWFDQEEVQPFDKSKLEFKDGDNTKWQVIIRKSK